MHSERKLENMALNHIDIMGRLTKDVELRRTNSGVAVASFTIACDRDFSDKETDFIDVVAWRQTGEFVSKHFSKGKMIVVSGRLQIRKWTDKDGNKRSTAEIVADNCYFGDSKKNEQDARPYMGGGRKANDAEMAEMNASDFSVLDGDCSELPF